MIAYSFLKNLYRFKKKKSYETKRKKESKGLEVKIVRVKYKFGAQSVKEKVWGCRSRDNRKC